MSPSYNRIIKPYFCRLFGEKTNFNPTLMHRHSTLCSKLYQSRFCPILGIGYVITSCLLARRLTAYQLPPRAVRSLGQVSSRLHSTFVPHLYRTVKFRAPSEWALNVIDIDTFFRLHKVTRGPCYLQHTRELSISAPILLARFNRCAYFNVFRIAGQVGGVGTVGTSNEMKAHEQFLDDISRQLHFVQACLKPNHLRSLQYVSCPSLFPPISIAHNQVQVAARHMPSSGLLGFRWLHWQASEGLDSYFVGHGRLLSTLRGQFGWTSFTIERQVSRMGWSPADF